VDAFVKVVRPNSDEARAAEALRHFGDRASVRVLGHEGSTIYLERIRPGTPLADLVDAGRDDLAMAHLCDVAARLHARGMPDTEWPMVEAWGRGFDRYRASLDRTIDGAHIDRAAAMFAELAASQSAKCLLHGDLHQTNILFDERRGWLAIDPKGVIGEPAYEFGAALRNPNIALADRRIGIITERTGLDRKRVAWWAYAQAVLSAVWCIEDGNDPARTIAAFKLLIRMVA
jgi:streptomycin 6-kinase